MYLSFLRYRQSWQCESSPVRHKARPLTGLPIQRGVGFTHHNVLPSVGGTHPAPGGKPRHCEPHGDSRGSALPMDPIPPLQFSVFLPRHSRRKKILERQQGLRFYEHSSHPMHAITTVRTVSRRAQGPAAHASRLTSAHAMRSVTALWSHSPCRQEYRVRLLLRVNNIGLLHPDPQRQQGLGSGI